MSTNNETTLINRILNGETNAFTQIVEGHKSLVFSLALRMLKNKEEAEEASQDTFVKVYRLLKSFKGDSKFSTWIYRIAYNTCLDRLKKQKKRFAELELGEISEYQIRTLGNVLDEMVQTERTKMITSCFKHLQAEDAALLTLFYFEEKNLKELESIVNLSANTIKVRLHRARKKLAIILTNKIEPEELRNYG